MVSHAAPLTSVDLSARLLEQTLDQLNEEEALRTIATLEGKSRHTKFESKSDQTAYASFSYTQSTSSDPANRKHNRWANIFAYDHSLLPGSYLNASLIPPYPLPDNSTSLPRRSYIASQAPLPHTFPTFYENILRQNVSIVVNLTPFSEHGRVKADRYWPLQGGEKISIPGFTIIQIADPETKVRKGLNACNTTKYQLRLRASETGMEHDFSLLHVPSWQDFGSFSASIFIEILDAIEEMASGQEPIWVHCSAGIGRSGTVIAALLAKDLGSRLPQALGLTVAKTAESVEMAALQAAKDMVDHERRYRAKMVQTAPQFGMIVTAIGAFLHEHTQS